ncbi:uncharacterized protein CDV56_100206, partial [Aspergillus thermomutatus]
FENATTAPRNKNNLVKQQPAAAQQAFSKSTDPSSSLRRPKPSLPDPEKFAGQSLKFDTWLPSIKAKLKIDGEAIGDAKAQFYYDFHTILEHLEWVYTNSNKIHEAEDRLLGLKQGDDDLPAFIAKFGRVLYEARGQTWPDTTKISALRRGLSTTIKNRLAQQLNLPTDYPRFLRVVQQLASGAPFSSTSAPSHSTGSKPTPCYPDSMKIGATDGAINGAINSISAISTGKNYWEEGCCFCCGSNEHFVKDCPSPPPGAGGGGGVSSRSTNQKTLWGVKMLKSLEARSDTSLD